MPETATATPGAGSIWRNSSFMFLWLAQLASQLADRIIFVVFIAFITEFYGSNESYTSYLYVAFTIPAILLTAAAGVFVDRWPRRLTLVMTNLLRAVLVLTLPWMAGNSLWSIFTLAFLLSSVTQFFVPAESATIPCIVPKAQLLQANSLFTTTMMASVIFGFALGDPLINAFSLGGVHWALFILFMLAALLLWGVRIPKALPCGTPELANKTLLQSFNTFKQELKEGFRYICENKSIWQAMLKLALLFSAVVSICILAISYAKQFLYLDASIAARKFAYIIAMAGVGMASGGVLISFPLKKIDAPLLVFSGMSIVAIGLGVMALIPVFLPDLNLLMFSTPPVSLSTLLQLDSIPVTQRMGYTYLASLLMGVGAAFIAIPLQSLLHARIPEDVRGKVLGVQFTILSTSSTAPALIAGLGTELIGVQLMMLLLGLPFALWGAYGLYHYFFEGRTRFR